MEESTSDNRRTLLVADRHIVTWWGTWAECASALNRRSHEGGLTGQALQELLQYLDSFAAGWMHIPSSPRLRQYTLRRQLRVHPLWAADAIQLAAAVTAAMGDPATLDFVSSDRRLSQAAQIEGFSVL